MYTVTGQDTITLILFKYVCPKVKDIFSSVYYELEGHSVAPVGYLIDL